jgi:hypothetical protein
MTDDERVELVRAAVRGHLHGIDASHDYQVRLPVSKACRAG